MQNTSKLQEPDSVPYILVVDDDNNIGELIVEALHIGTSHQAIWAASAFEALRFAKDLKPGLIILDYWLPGMNGLELYDWLRRVEGLADIPVIFMSTYAPRRELERRGISCIEKPFKLRELFSRVKQFLP